MTIDPQSKSDEFEKFFYEKFNVKNEFKSIFSADYKKWRKVWDNGYEAGQKSVANKLKLPNDFGYKIAREWKHHWQDKEKGYFDRAFGIDANMTHHLGKLIDEAVEKLNPDLLGDEK